MFHSVSLRTTRCFSWRPWLAYMQPVKKCLGLKDITVTSHCLGSLEPSSSAKYTISTQSCSIKGRIGEQGGQEHGLDRLKHVEEHSAQRVFIHCRSKAAHSKLAVHSPLQCRHALQLCVYSLFGSFGQPGCLCSHAAEHTVHFLTFPGP